MGWLGTFPEKAPLEGTGSVRKRRTHRKQDHPNLSKGKQPRKQSKPSQRQLHPSAEQEQPRLLCLYPQQGRTAGEAQLRVAQRQVLLPARLQEQTPLHPVPGCTGTKSQDPNSTSRKNYKNPTQTSVIPFWGSQVGSSQANHFSKRAPGCSDKASC